MWVRGPAAVRRAVVRRIGVQQHADRAVLLRRADGQEVALPVAAGDAEDGLPVATWRFGSERAQVTTYNAPLAIVPLFE